MLSMKAEAALAQAKAGLHLIPEHMRSGVIRYIHNGQHVGDFLTALLDGDPLCWRRADPMNLAAGPAWVKFLSEHAPQNCWGAKNKRRAWQHAHGLQGWEP
jgi:hypothetical protein